MRNSPHNKIFITKWVRIFDISDKKSIILHCVDVSTMTFNAHTHTDSRVNEKIHVVLFLVLAASSFTAQCLVVWAYRMDRRTKKG